MALHFFDDESTGNGSLPFASDYLEEHPKANGKEFEVKELYRTQSNKGYMLITDCFSGFLFKNQKLTKQLLEALQLYCDKQDGYALIAVLDKSAKNKFRLAVDFEKPRSWFTRGNEHFVTSESGLELKEVPKGNPFLPPVLSTPDMTPAHTQEASNGKGGRKRGLENAITEF